MSEPRDLSKVTVDQWRQGIIAALKEHNVQAVGSLVRAMAAYHPNEAEEIRQSLLLGVAISTSEATR